MQLYMSGKVILWYKRPTKKIEQEIADLSDFWELEEEKMSP
jgi:hypothetical protein